MRNNYDVMESQARALFLRHDFDACCRRLGLTPTAEGLALRFLGEPVFLRRGDGRVLRADGGDAGFHAALSVYDVLCREGEPPRLRGEFVPLPALNRIRGTHSVHETLNAADAAFFSRQVEALRRACVRLGGVPGGKGDVCFLFPVFDFFPVCLRLWEADEEFPASLQFLFDAAALDFAHYETLWYMAGALTARLRREMDGEGGETGGA